MDSGALLVVVVIILLAGMILAKTAIVVPQQSAFVVERLGKYAGTLNAGFHILTPFVDVIRYRHSLKEQAIDIPEQVCITRDNVQVGVDGILYLKVLNPERASYGISDFGFAIRQLAQTNLRSEVGKIDLDRTFEERTAINAQVVSELDKATEPWGVKVLRYEIKTINPPHDILSAMEKQMRAEREKRATILNSEANRESAINTADGEKQKVIKASEARRQQQINEAEGEANAILAIASATAEGLRRVAGAINEPGGFEAVQLRVAEQYVGEFGKIAKDRPSSSPLGTPADPRLSSRSPRAQKRPLPPPPPPRGPLFPPRPPPPPPPPSPPPALRPRPLLPARPSSVPRLSSRPLLVGRGSWGCSALARPAPPPSGGGRVRRLALGAALLARAPRGRSPAAGGPGEGGSRRPESEVTGWRAGSTSESAVTSWRSIRARAASSGGPS